MQWRKKVTTIWKSHYHHIRYSLECYHYLRDVKNESSHSDNHVIALLKLIARVRKFTTNFLHIGGHVTTAHFSSII